MVELWRVYWLDGHGNMRSDLVYAATKDEAATIVEQRDEVLEVYRDMTEIAMHTQSTLHPGKL